MTFRESGMKRVWNLALAVFMTLFIIFGVPYFIMQFVFGVLGLERGTTAFWIAVAGFFVAWNGLFVVGGLKKRKSRR